MAIAGTPEFYRQQAERLTKLASEAVSPAARLELLEIAASFQRLAAFASAAANRNGPDDESLSA